MLRDVRIALLHGLQTVFFWTAVLMSASIVLHVLLKREPLRGGAYARTAATV
jgi:hypothetical protein